MKNLIINCEGKVILRFRSHVQSLAVKALLWHLQPSLGDVKGTAI